MKKLNPAGPSESSDASDSPVRSFAQTNRELAEAFERYLISRGFSAPTLRAYMYPSTATSRCWVR